VNYEINLDVIARSEATWQSLLY